ASGSGAGVRGERACRNCSSNVGAIWLQGCGPGLLGEDWVSLTTLTSAPARYTIMAASRVRFGCRGRPVYSTGRLPFSSTPLAAAVGTRQPLHDPLQATVLAFQDDQDDRNGLHKIHLPQWLG